MDPAAEPWEMEKNVRQVQEGGQTVCVKQCVKGVSNSGIGMSNYLGAEHSPVS